MKQIVQSFKSGELWLAELPVPYCKSKGAIVQTQVSFVSAGTEKMLVDFAKKGYLGKALAMPDQVKKVIRKVKSEGLFETIEKVKTKLEQPIPLGYSSAGIIVEVGERLQGFQVGDFVACAGAGYANHAEFNYIPQNLLVKIPDGVSFEDASSATVGSIAMQGVRQCELHLGERVCVFGLGLLGLIAVQILKASGCMVMGVDPNPQRCQKALELGADCVTSDQPIEQAQAFSQSMGLDAVLITAATKSNEPVYQAGEMCRMKGNVVITGMVGMDIPRDAYYKKELNVKLSLSYGPGRYDSNYEEKGIDYPFGHVRWTEQRNIAAYLDLLASGKITPQKFITHRFEFENALDAYQLLLEQKEPHLGITLKYPESQSTELQRCIEYNTIAASDGKHSIGFIGAGNFSKAVLLPALNKRADILKYGICTSTGINCGETAKKENFSKAFTDYPQLLRDPECQAVFITTQHNTHAKITLEALSNGKHVFVEKPLAITRKELKDMADFLNQNSDSPLLMIGFNRRFSPHAVKIKSYFSKRNGPLQLHYRINAGFIPADHWTQDPESGGGRIIGEACHFIDFASFIVGSPVTTVQAMCLQPGETGPQLYDNVSINLTHSDGSVSNIFYTASGSQDLTKERCEIFSSQSVAIMENFTQTRFKGKLGNEKYSTRFKKGFDEELDAFFRAVSGKSPAPIEISSILNTTEACLAALEAIKQNETIRLTYLS